MQKRIKTRSSQAFALESNILWVCDQRISATILFIYYSDYCRPLADEINNQRDYEGQ